MHRSTDHLRDSTVAGHFGTKTLRHQDSSAPRNWCRSGRTLRHQFFFGAELSRGHFGLVPTVRHQETGAEVAEHFGTSFFFGAELSRGHFGLVPKCLYALTRTRLRRTTRLYCKIVFIVLFKPLSPEFNIVHVRKTAHVEVVM